MSEKSDNQIVIIAGPNGAGKTSLAPHLLRDWLGLLEYVNADTIAQGLSAFQPEQAAFDAGRIMLKRLHELAEQQKSFAFETTLATRSYAVWLRRLQKNGYHVSLMFLWLRNPELAVERVRRRVASGGHDIPEETIRRRYRKGIRNFLALYQPFADEWGIYDNSDWGPLSLITSGSGIASGSGQTSQTIFIPELWAKFCEAAK